MGKLPSLQALKQKLKLLMGKRPDQNSALEKPWKRQRNSQAQVYEEIFSSEISSILRHWERTGDLELRADLQEVEDWKKKCKDSPPPPLPPRSNALHRIACPHQAVVLDVGNSGGRPSNPDGGLSITRDINEEKGILVKKKNYNVSNKETTNWYPKPRLQVHKKKGFARKKISFVV